jgi:hypothetical protein
MAKWLRQSTASQEIVIGRMVDATDGNTAETGLTIANTDIDIWKHGATTLADKNSGGATHIAGGIYSAVLDATDTDTLGNLKIFVQVAGALSWEDSYTVLPANVYDSLVLGTDVLDVSVTQWLGTAAATPTVAGVPEVDVTHWLGTAAATPTTAGVPEVDVTHFAGSSLGTLTGAYPALGIAESGTMQAGSTGTTAVLRAATSFADDNPIGYQIWITGGTGVGQTRFITDWVSATDTATVATWTVTPDNTSTYIVFPSAAGTTDADITAIKTKTDFLPSATAGSAGGLFIAGSNAATTVNITGNLTGNVSGSVGSVTGAVGSVTGAVGSVTGLTASDVGAIKAKTDSLTFTTAGIVDANIQQINDVTITGNGQTGTEFNVV